MAKIKLTSEQIAKVERYIARQMKLMRIPGLAVGIYNRGGIMLAKGYGVGDLDNKVPVKPKTIFCLASMGKQFVSAAIMILVEEGKLNLNDGLAKYFTGAPQSWRLIKIKHMLSHTSGLDEYENDSGLADDEANGPKSLFYSQANLSEDELVKRTKKMPIKFNPGEKWTYCNTNYMLLGIIIHKVTGKFWFDYVKERILRPLGMNSVRFVYKKDAIKDIPSGYELREDRLKRSVWWSDTFNSAADGAFYCNVLDLAKWDKALYGTKLLKKSSLNRMWTVFKLNNGKPNPYNYGFGWFMNSINGHRIIGHDGGWQGFSSHIARYVDDEMTVVVLDNLFSSDAIIIAHEIAGRLNPSLSLDA